MRPSALLTSPNPRNSASQFGASPLGEEFRLVALAIGRRIWLVFSVIGLFVFLCIAYIWMSEVQYSATSEILIDPRSKKLVEREVAPTGLGSSSLGGDTLMLDSQIEVIRSLSVLEQVIRKNNLLSDPEFGGGDQGNGRSVVRGVVRWLVRGPQALHLPDETAFDRALRKLQSKLRVERKSNTYVVGISVQSRDRFKAARIANSISSIYVNESNVAANSVAQEAAKSLGLRLKKLQNEATAAGRRVEDYRAQSGLTRTPDMLLIEQQLKELNTQLSAARAASKEQRARWREVRAAARSSKRRGGLASRLNSPLLTQLTLQLTLAKARETEQSAFLLPNHPLVRSVGQRRRAIERAIATEVSEIVARQKINYDVAVLQRASS